jgi:hypothetical protein
MRKTVGVLLVAVCAALILASPAAAAKPTGSFTTPLTVEPTVIQVDGYTFTVSGTVTADVTQFALDEQGNLVAVATISGTLTVSEPTLGTATIDVTGTRVVLHAKVQADCSGHLRIDCQGVLRLNATVTRSRTRAARRRPRRSRRLCPCMGRWTSLRRPRSSGRSSATSATCSRGGRRPMRPPTR